MLKGPKRTRFTLSVIFLIVIWAIPIGMGAYFAYEVISFLIFEAFIYSEVFPILGAAIMLLLISIFLIFLGIYSILDILWDIWRTKKQYAVLFNLPSLEEVENGNPGAQHDMGHAYEYGVGLSHDLQLAADWYRKAARQGFAPSCTALAKMYEQGQGVHKDLAQAEMWYNRAAELYQKNAEAGNHLAQNNLGVMYLCGEGVSQNLEEAEKLFLQSASKGCVEAMISVGMMYWKGMGVSKDRKKAVAWFGKAVESEGEKVLYELDLWSYIGIKWRIKSDR